MKKKFIVSTNISESEAQLINRLSSLSGATVSTVIRSLIRKALVDYTTSDSSKSVMLNFTTVLGGKRYPIHRVIKHLKKFLKD